MAVSSPFWPCGPTAYQQKPFIGVYRARLIITVMVSSIILNRGFWHLPFIFLDSFPIDFTSPFCLVVVIKLKRIVGTDNFHRSSVFVLLFVVMRTTAPSSKWLKFAFRSGDAAYLTFKPFERLDWSSHRHLQTSGLTLRWIALALITLPWVCRITCISLYRQLRLLKIDVTVPSCTNQVLKHMVRSKFLTPTYLSK